MKYPRISLPSLVIVLALLGATRLGANQVTYSYEVGRGGPSETLSLNFTTIEFGYVQITGEAAGEPGSVNWTLPDDPDPDGTSPPALKIDFGGREFNMYGSELRGTPEDVEAAVFTELQGFWATEGGTITVVPDGGPALALTALVLGSLCLIAGVRRYQFATR